MSALRCWLLLVSLSLAAPTPATTSETHPGQNQFLNDLARSRKADPATRAEWKRLLDQAVYQDKIIQAISKPAEATRTWKDYRPIFLTDKRVRDGIAFWREHRQILDRISADTGVAAEVLLAIVGVETSYGRITGGYRVVDALATLAFYYPPRAPFFQSELKQFLTLPSQQFPIDPVSVSGSYAGAMGWGQFMPTSYANYARDFDGDGKIDLWNSPGDVLASVANYFVAHGWQPDAPVAELGFAGDQARLPKLDGTAPIHTVATLAKFGYTIAEPLAPDLPATLLVLEGAAGPEYWITHKNFQVISRYNRSPLYSMAVYQLSRELAAGIAEAVASNTP
ncbi:MAG: lytic murein transglycosylase B [Lysobacterales bacterium]